MNINKSNAPDARGAPAAPAELVAASNRYGADPRYVLAGGGNSSWKDESVMYVKSSGTRMATIKAEGFTGMSRERLKAILLKHYDRADDARREAAVLADLNGARLPGFESMRPSVETLLHELFPYAYVFHLHPALVNGLTCGARGEAAARELFGDSAVWVPEYKPGYELAKLCERLLAEYAETRAAPPKLLLHQNHGVFVAADTVAEIDDIYNDMFAKLNSRITIRPENELRTGAICDVTDGAYGPDGSDSAGGITSSSDDADGMGGGSVSNADDADETVGAGARRPDSGGANYAAARRVMQRIMSLPSPPTAALCMNGPDIMALLDGPEQFRALSGAFTPDHIVYCKARFLYIDGDSDGDGADDGEGADDGVNYSDSDRADSLPERYAAFAAEYGYKPRVICVRGAGAFAAADTRAETENAAALFADAVNVALYSQNFGGPHFLSDELTEFIVNWEVESYRQKVTR